jgi:hypothetical protein
MGIPDVGVFGAGLEPQRAEVRVVAVGDDKGGETLGEIMVVEVPGISTGERAISSWIAFFAGFSRR